jgi:hypothetical protein
MANYAHEFWSEFAGIHYHKMMESKQAALALVFHPDRNVRIAAIQICDTVWNCTTDASYVEICRNVIKDDCDAVVRASAISAIGKAFRSSQSPEVSKFLSKFIAVDMDVIEVQSAAYWALREVQLGLLEEDLIKRAICAAKSYESKLPSQRLLDEQRFALMGGRYPEEVWDSAGEIDWDFVNQFTPNQ